MTEYNIKYSIYDRIKDEDYQISEENAGRIIKPAPLHAGPYGGMGVRVDNYLCKYDEDSAEHSIVAIRYDGEWLVVPEHQSTFISFELSQTAYDDILATL